MQSIKYLAAVAMAAAFTTATAQQAPCKTDVEKFCKEVQPGEGRVLKCLEKHKADLSPGCADNMKNLKAELKKLSDACKGDVEKFCWETPIGKGGIANCLTKHSGELSEGCKSAVASAKAKKKAAAPRAAKPAQ